MHIQFSSHVERDLEEIGDWIAQGSPSRAVTFVQELRREIRRIGDNPRLFRLRPEIRPDLRLATFGRYLILFRIADNMVHVERVVYGGRDLMRLLN
jgi:toxin ParE1/3/4